MGPCEFTLAHYRDILVEAKAAGFDIMPFRDTARLGALPNQIILRHDIDFSIRDALAMAKVEAALGIAATYCVLLHSSSYHVGELDALRALREIAALGHEIALHYDLHFFQEAGIDPTQGIKDESQMLASLAGVPILTVAQHRPATDGQFKGVDKQFIDAYDARLVKDITYVSDSRRVWRQGCFHDMLPRGGRYQLLIHPEWWEAEGPMARRATVERISRERTEEVSAAMQAYATSLGD